MSTDQASPLNKRYSASRPRTASLLKYFSILALFASFAPAGAQQETDEVAALQGMVKEWTELRRVISETQSEWKVDKVFLEENLDLLNRQIQVINDKLKETEGVGDSTGVEIDKLDLKKKELVEASDALSERIQVLEGAVKKLVLRFPPPLLDTVEPLLRRIPADPTDTDLALGQRLQNVVGIISLAEKFNSSLIYRGEVRSLNGAEKQVWTLYWGLAASFSADSEGTGALLGFPTNEGWTFEERPEMTDTIVRLIQIYDGSSDPQFVETPATVR